MERSDPVDARLTACGLLEAVLIGDDDAEQRRDQVFALQGGTWTPVFYNTVMSTILDAFVNLSEDYDDAHAKAQTVIRHIRDQALDEPPA